MQLVKKLKLSMLLTKHHAMKTHWGSGGIAQSIHNHGTRWKLVGKHVPAALPPV